ncbi:hypothetical protein GWO43_01935 [candidate division KSB1 bacterium]|nr:hypothetical protein [candidate division KSB1 bacterium]NIR69483.1 hypothetical protein [candidate division KSB1 bacterium]NIS22833.1 hypothetical protein [candidate division KSB1 bacterium]NIT69672.1 hypothetical protein [candidate division KSB1 bacterium]NIU23342.1 hypothetical protein [candidate division KSB1 bacterium]
MKKNRIEFDSPLDAFVAIAKELNDYERRYAMTSEEFYDKFSKGQLDDSIDNIEWANDYQLFLSLRRELEDQLRRVA